MARYRMDDGTVLDTDNAKDSWEEARRWDGNNMIGVSSGSQWSYETLYRSRKGRYYLERSSACEWIGDREAARWLLLNEEELPEDLSHLEDDIVE